MPDVLAICLSVSNTMSTVSGLGLNMVGCALRDSWNLSADSTNGRWTNLSDLAEVSDALEVGLDLVRLASGALRDRLDHERLSQPQLERLVLGTKLHST